MKKRIEYFDGIKGFAILLVVFCHNVLLSKETILGNLTMALAWSAVPCFMMVSGALMHHTNRFVWKKYFVKIGQIYLVMVIWRLVYWMVLAPLKGTQVPKVDVLQYLFFFSSLDGISVGFMWYTIAYLIVLLVYPATWYQFRCCGKDGQKIVLFLMIVAFSGSIFLEFSDFCVLVFSRILGCDSFQVSGFSKIMPFTNYGNMLFYFLLGAFLLEYQEQIQHRLRRLFWLPPVMILAGISGLVFVKYFTEGTVRWEGIYIPDGYMRLSTVVVSLGVFLLFMQDWTKLISHLLAKCFGQYTLGIYYLHVLLLSLAEIFIYPFFTPRSFLVNCGKTIIVAVICTLLTILLRKIPVIRKLVV